LDPWIYGVWILYRRIRSTLPINVLTRAQVTVDRLGVYRPEEHIDNPKDYADNIDARQFDRRLRGPVDPRELQVDPRTGIKNYIANEQGGWATSTRYIRESLLRAIDMGRRGQHDEKAMFEALRLLGQVTPKASW
jgi:hypothetical protein